MKPEKRHIVDIHGASCTQLVLNISVILSHYTTILTFTYPFLQYGFLALSACLWSLCLSFRAISVTKPIWLIHS